MFRFFRRFLLVTVLAAGSAAGIILWLSADPMYAVREWVGGSRYWAYDRLIHEYAKKRNLDPMLVKAIVWRESAFHPDKVGTSGERGLMQVGESAALDWVRVEKVETFVPTDLLEPTTNIEVGTWYFARALERWKSKEDPLPFALAEYNAGRGRVDRWVAATNMGEKATAEDLMSVLDFPTTRRYIEDITARFRFYQERGRM
ncbi:MAG: lytic transglycosylase domain-containing protein [Verrucomicrobiota bacterium]